MAAHCAVNQDRTENIMPSKRDSHSRIDGITASIIGLSRAMHVPVKKRSVYETRDLLEV
jgi:hypothetical protein